MPSWVDQPTYFGPDRRKRSGGRLLSRRRQNLAGNPPALRTALRRLHLQAQSAATHTELVSIERRAAALASITDEAGAPIVQELLKELGAALAPNADTGAARSRIEAALAGAIAAC